MAVLVLIVASLAIVFGFQAAGYAPCELCLQERKPFYLGAVLAVVTIAFAWRARGLATSLCFAALAALFVFSAAFGVYHAGVEWGFWAGPTDCTGAIGRATTNAEFLRDLRTVRVVRCDAVAIRILGLSLAGWNAVVSLTIAGVALVGLVMVRSPRGKIAD